MELAIQTGNSDRWKVGVRFGLLLAMVVVTMKCQTWTKRTKETLKVNKLFTLRTWIDEYTFDRQRAPRTIEDLVDSGYLRSVPRDPFTGKALSISLPGRGKQDVFDVR